MLWLDAGNPYNSGQVLLGNALRSEQLRGVFDPSTGVCRALPAPSLQRPDLIEAPPIRPRGDATNCGVAVTQGDHSATIKQVMAALAASYVDRLLNGRCGWMASYLDLDNGTLLSVSAEPRQVGSIVGLHVAALVVRERRCSA